MIRGAAKSLKMRSRKELKMIEVSQTEGESKIRK